MFGFVNKVCILLSSEYKMLLMQLKINIKANLKQRFEIIYVRLIYITAT